MKMLSVAVLVIGVTACTGTSEPTPTSIIAASPTATLAPTGTTLPSPTPDPIWDVSEKGLPEIHSDNARVEETEIGASIYFEQEGEEYEIRIPNPQGEVIDIAAKSAEDGKIRIQLFNKVVESVLAKIPEVAFGIPGEEQLAWYDLEAGDWIKRYEVYFEHDGNYPDFPSGDKLFDDEGGYIWHEETPENVIVRLRLAFGGRLKRIIVEKFKDFGDESIFWISMTYGNENKIVHIPIFSKGNEVAEFIGITYGSNMRSPEYMPKDGFSQEEILESLKSSSYVQVNVDIFKDGFYGSVANNELALARAVELFLEFGDEQKLFEDAVIGGDYSKVPDNLRIGFFFLWVMLPQQ